MIRATRNVTTGGGIPARTGVALLARVRMGTGQLATRASVSTIAYTVSNVTLGTTLGTGTFATSTIYDSLQQSDSRWQQDSAIEPSPVDGTWGYNWAAALPATLFALTTLAAADALAGEPAAQQIQCDVVFTPVSGEPFRLIFRWLKLPTYG